MTNQLECTDLREQLLAEPHKKNDEIDGHLSLCEACAQFSKENLTFNEHILEAMQVPVPKENKISVASAMAKKVRPWYLGTPAMSIAAGILLVFGVLLVNNISPSVELDSLVLEHIAKEAYAIKEGNAPTMAAIDDTLNSVGLTLTHQSADKIIFAKKCYIGKKLSAHLVIQGPNKPVSIVLIPQNALSSAVNFKLNHVFGKIMPFLKNTSLAVVAETPDDADFGMAFIEREIKE